MHGIERLDLSGVQPDNDSGESGRSENSMDPVSLPSTASYSSPDTKVAKENGREQPERRSDHVATEEAQEEIADV
ncbi:unnamed protein product [Heligmosomoides polygyrus]|uniref:Uncharacterized protein n=1 Tax=Heligmosomoides polygyrus TaxID=6339 RepID=A0A183GRX5_HELPZ|nr:unnamed protein product [Heligmosomoides polygyrus]